MLVGNARIIYGLRTNKKAILNIAFFIIGIFIIAKIYIMLTNIIT